MKEQLLDALIAEGYTGKDVYEYENCIHEFDVCLVFRNTIDDKPETRALCMKCGCDEHAAQLMGFNPMYYKGNEKLV